MVRTCTWDVAGSENENQIACRITARYIQRVHCTGTASSIPEDTDVFCKDKSDNNSSEHQITLHSRQRDLLPHT